MEEIDNTKVGCYGCLISFAAIFVVSFIVTFCSNDDKKEINGPKVMIVQRDCVGCIDIDTFNQCVRYSNNNDAEGIMNLLLMEKAYIIQAGQECVVVDENVARTKIRVTVPGGKRVEVYVPPSILE